MMGPPQMPGGGITMGCVGAPGGTEGMTGPPPTSSPEYVSVPVIVTGIAAIIDYGVASVLCHCQAKQAPKCTIFGH